MKSIKCFTAFYFTRGQSDSTEKSVPIPAPECWQSKCGFRTDRPFEFFWFVFVNFDCIICIYYNCSQHTMFIQFVIYSRYKNIGYVWRDINTIPRPQEFYSAPGFDILWSANAKISIYNTQFDILDNIYFWVIVSQVELKIKVLNKQLYPSNVISSLWPQSIWTREFGFN